MSRPRSRGMKNIALAAILALSTLASVRPADACGGGYGTVAPRETAAGIWPTLVGDEHGVTHLRLVYPRFTLSGDYLYVADFVVVRDGTFRRFERELARGGKHALGVDVEEVRSGTWRVVGWTKRA